MINHARTLLLNIDGGTYSPGVLGEEYIPTYRPLKLSPALQSVYKVLFGSRPDKVFLNFRAYELLSIIHRTELAEFIYALDPRVTYWPTKYSDFYRAGSQIDVTKLGGSADSRIYTTGVPAANSRRGSSVGEYAVKLIQRGGELRVYVIEPATGSIIDTPITVPGPVLGLTPPVKLPNTDIEVRIADYVNPISFMLLEQYPAEEFLLQESDERIELEPNTQAEQLALKRRMALLNTDAIMMSWNIKTYARPESAIIECLPQLEFLGEPTLIELFGVDTNAEPYATFRNMWFDNKHSVYRLSGIVLAFIYRMNERYNG